MAMSNRINRELLKQRELLWHFLEGETCYFCEKILATPPWKVKFGNAGAPPIDSNTITIHHINGNHSDNRKRNRALCHQSCHKSHHAKLVFGAFNRQTRGAA